MKPVTVLASSIRLVFPLLLATAMAQAANSRWTGAAGDGVWTNPLNWNNGVPGGLGTTSPDAVAFPTSASTTVTADAGRNIAELKFDNSTSIDGTGASSFTINGGPILFSAPSASPTGLPTLHVLGMFGKNTEAVNAPININGNTGNNDLLIATSNGFDGTLLVNGPISSAATSGTTSITARVGAGGALVLGGAISNGIGTNLVKLALATSNNGTVTMTGANSFTGGVSVGNGTLILDHSVNATVVSSAQPLTIGAGTLIVRGKSTGTTAVALDAATGNDLSILAQTGARLVVDNNGGAGTTLTLGNTWTRSSGSTLLIDLSSGSTLTSSPTLLNSVVTAGTTAAGFWVKDATGTGFATVAGGNVVRYTGAVALTGLGGDTTNYKTTGGTLSGATTFNTLEFDSSNAADSRVLDLGANNLTPKNALGLLATGSNDFTVTGTTGTINAASVFYQGSTGVFDLEVNLNGGFTKAGPGFMIVGSKSTLNFTMEGGITRFTGQDVINNGNLAISSGAVMEIGTDMNGAATAGDFTRAIGTGASAFQIVGSGGFSAFGGTRVVNVGGLTAAVNWGSGTTDLLNGTFILSSERSDSTLEFQNPITLAGVDRAIQVNNGSADVDARLTGALTSSGPTGIVKTGNGTLELSGTSTYTGQTRIDAGRLLITGSLSGTNAVLIGSGASVKLGADLAINGNAQLRLEGGSLLTDGHSVNLGQLSLGGNSNIDFGNGFNSVLFFADSTQGAWAGTLSILNWTGDSDFGGGFDRLFFGGSPTGITAGQLAAIQFVNPDNLPAGIYAAKMLDTGEVVSSTTMVPEPSAWVMMGSGLALLLSAHRRRKE